MADAEARASKPVLRPPRQAEAAGNGTGPETPPSGPARGEIPRDYVDPEWASMTSPEKCGLYLAKTRKTLAEVTGDPNFMPTRETVQVGGPMLSLGLRHSRSEFLLQLIRRSPMIALALVALVVGIVIGIPSYLWWRRREAARQRAEPYVAPEPEPMPAAEHYQRPVDQLPRGVQRQDGRPTGQQLGWERNVG